MLSRLLPALLLTGLLSAADKPKVILFIWDGLRPDSITMTDTPTLAGLRARGMNFPDHHSTYPTFTMMNAATFATGAYPGQTGFYGNVLWQPAARGTMSTGAAIDFAQPVFTEDYGVLDALARSYDGQLLAVPTLFAAAQAKGLVTATVGKSGPAYLQDYRRGGLILEERLVFPLSLVRQMQAAGDPLPATTPLAYPPGTLTLAANNGTPTVPGPVIRLADEATSDPTAADKAPQDEMNRYLLRMYVKHVLPKQPDLTVLWLRSPDSAEHQYGPGSPAYHDALRQQDALLGKLLEALKAIPRTNLIIASDHGHSNVAGDPKLFPPRAIHQGQIGGPQPNGFPVSGEVRTADLLRRAGFAAFDGGPCTDNPVMSGLRADSQPVYPRQQDPDGKLCGKPGSYVTKPYPIPATLPADALVIASNGGSDYVYLPRHDRVLAARAVRFFQSRLEYGAVFAHTRYGTLPGTLPLTAIHAENAAGRGPDLIVSMNFDADTMVQGLPGRTYSGVYAAIGAVNARGMHGSFSPRDVHNTLIAFGPDFRAGLTGPLPTANVDVAPTIAALLGFALPQADGRVLREAFTPTPARAVTRIWQPKAPARRLQCQLPTNPDGHDLAAATTYTFSLRVKEVRQEGRVYRYFDSAVPVRR